MANVEMTAAKTRPDDGHYVSMDQLRRVGLSPAKHRAGRTISLFRDRLTLKARDSLELLCKTVTCLATTMNRGLERLLERDALLRVKGGGSGNLTICTGVMLPPETVTASKRMGKARTPKPPGASVGKAREMGLL